jgi:RHS repeat-associated protein
MQINSVRRFLFIVLGVMFLAAPAQAQHKPGLKRYDEQGRLRTSDGDDGTQWLYTYDADGDRHIWVGSRLIATEKSDGTVIAYAYNAEGRRVRKRTTRPGRTPEFFDYPQSAAGSHQNAGIPRTDPPRLSQAVFTRSEPLQADETSVPSDRDVVYSSREIDTDQFHRIIRVVSTTGDVTTYEYFPDVEEPYIKAVTYPDGTRHDATYASAKFTYNAILPLTASALRNDSAMCEGSSNRVGFGGYFYSCSTKTYLTPAGRMYDPEIARFQQQDSYLGKIDDPPSLHRYYYANNNPTRYVDPTGHQTLPATEAEATTFRAEINRRLAASPGKPVEFKDRGVNVVVLPLPKPSIVARTAMTFTGSALSRDTMASETTINTNLYDFSMTTGSHAQGEVVSGGTVVGGRTSPLTFNFSYDSKRPATIAKAKEAAFRALPGGAAQGPPAPPVASDAWQFGAGDPPHTAEVGMGGGIPMLIEGMPYGSSNKYSAGAPAGLPLTGDPGIANQPFLVQRSNKGFDSQATKMGTLGGKTVMGLDRNQGLMYVVIEENMTTPGMTLPDIRDSLSKAGVNSALSWDGSDSATLVRDSTVVAKPGWRKDVTIPFGVEFTVP